MSVSMQATRSAALTLYLQKAMHARKDRQWHFVETACVLTACLPRSGISPARKILKKIRRNFAGNSGCLVRLSVRHSAVGADAAAWMWLSMQD